MTMYVSDERVKQTLSEIIGWLKAEPVETGRLRMRPFEEKDFDDYYAIISSETVQKMAGMDAYTEEEARTSLFPQVLALGEKLQATYAVERVEDEKVIASFSFEMYPRMRKERSLADKKGISIAFMVLEAAQNRGYMRELLPAVLDYLLEQHGLDYVNAGYFSFNEASRRLQESAGMFWFMSDTYEFHGQKIITHETIRFRKKAAAEAAPAATAAVRRTPSGGRELRVGMDLSGVADQITLPDNESYEVISKVAYLIGVPVWIFEHEKQPPKKEYYDQMEKEKPARIIRNLSVLRNGALINYTKIRNAIVEENRGISGMKEYLSETCMESLKEDGVHLGGGENDIRKYIIWLNLEIQNRINNCKDLFPADVDWNQLSKIFVMPDGLNEDGMHLARRTYQQNMRAYPYRRYMNWPVEWKGNILKNDRTFLALLAEWNGEKPAAEPAAVSALGTEGAAAAGAEAAGSAAGVKQVVVLLKGELDAAKLAEQFPGAEVVVLSGDDALFAAEKEHLQKEAVKQAFEKKLAAALTINLGQVVEEALAETGATMREDEKAAFLAGYGLEKFVLKLNEDHDLRISLQ